MRYRNDQNARRWPRRGWLLGSAALAGALGLVARRGRAATAGRDEPIVQPWQASREAFTERAFEMKRQAEQAGDQAFGAVVVRDGQVVGQAPSRVVTRGDPTAHAEMEAIRDAARRLGTRDLGGCVLYSSSRPCPMCEAAAFWAGISGLLHGAAGTEGGTPRLRSC